MKWKITIKVKKQMMMRNNVLILMFSLVTSLGLLSPAFSAEFSLPESRTSVNVGDTFSVPVTLSPAGSQIDTARVVMSYDPARLRATGFQLVSALNNSAPASFIDHLNGVISWGGFDMVERIGSTTMFGVASFKAVSAGEANVSLAPSSHIISGGQEVGIPNNDRLTVVVNPTTSNTTANKQDNTTELSTPEYNYKIVRSSFLCEELPQVCTQPWWVALVSLLLLVTGILILLISHPHLSNKTKEDESN